MNDPASPSAPFSTGRDRPLFLLSFRQRDELAALAATAGWRVVAARRADGLASRVIASGAAVVVVDARGAIEDGLRAVQTLSDAVGAQGIALLALVSRGDAARLGEFYDAGATQFLASPMREAEFIQALRFAARNARRTGDGGGGPAAESALGWRYDPALASIQVTPALASLLGLEGPPSVREILRCIDATDRTALRAALRRLRAGGLATAFAHELSGAGRVVEHLQRDARTGRIHALIERLGPVDASAVLREALTGVRDPASARRWIDRRIADGRTVALALVALNRFDVVNNGYGREVGDALLDAAAMRVEGAARNLAGRRAIVARMNGPVFLIASDDAAADMAGQMTAGIETALDRPFVIGETILPMGARVVSVVADPGEDAAAARALLGQHEGAACVFIGCDRLAACQV
ncbi:MAG: diguanylate cyclase, partial [Alphaproteobacteria bacterium HGW-Alphaproteobacteria-16]